MFNVKLRSICISFFCLEVIYRVIAIISNCGLPSVNFCTCADTVLSDNIFVFMLCFMTYRLLFVEKPFQELPQNVFISACTVLIMGKAFEKFCPEM